MSYQSVNPFDGIEHAVFSETTDVELDVALEAAEHCFKSWQHTTFAERAAIAHQAASLIREREDKFASMMTLEMGKRLIEAKGEVALSADIIDYYAKHAEHFLSTEQLLPATGSAVIESAPFGVLFGVQPWNFPYYQLARFAAPNLMAGNVVMVKHAGNVPQCAMLVRRSVHIRI